MVGFYAHITHIIITLMQRLCLAYTYEVRNISKHHMSTITLGSITRFPVVIFIQPFNVDKFSTNIRTIMVSKIKSCSWKKNKIKKIKKPLFPLCIYIQREYRLLICYILCQQQWQPQLDKKPIKVRYNLISFKLHLNCLS